MPLYYGSEVLDAGDTGIALVVEYLNVCNRALVAHRDEFPYKQLFAVYEKILADRQLACMIFEEDPERIELVVTIQLKDGRFEPVPQSVAEPFFHLKVKRSYMERVIRDPQVYVDHPENLDWDWLTSRLGLESQP